MNKARYRCPACRTRRTGRLFLLVHCRATGHAVCNCGGYHHAHRPGSPFCCRNALSDLRHAERAGESEDVLLEIFANCAWDNPGTPTRLGSEPPF